MSTEGGRKGAEKTFDIDNWDGECGANKDLLAWHNPSLIRRLELDT